MLGANCLPARHFFGFVEQAFSRRASFMQIARHHVSASRLPPDPLVVSRLAPLPFSWVDPRWAIALHQVDPGDGLHAGTKHSRVGLDPGHTRETLGVVGLPFCSFCFFASAFRCLLGSLGPCRFVSFRSVSFRLASPRLARFRSIKAGVTASPAHHGTHVKFHVVFSASRLPSTT